MKSALQTLITLRHEFPQTSRPPPVEIEIDFRAQSGRGGGDGGGGDGVEGGERRCEARGEAAPFVPSLLLNGKRWRRRRQSNFPAD